MGKLVRRTLGGDTVVAEWSPDDPDSVRAAEQALRREVDAGYVAMRSDSDESRFEPTEELPPDAGVVVPPNDARSLRDALSRLLAEPNVLARFAKGAREARARLPRWSQACADAARILIEAANR